MWVHHETSHRTTGTAGGRRRRVPALLAGAALTLAALAAAPGAATAQGDGNALDETEHHGPGTFQLDVTSYDAAIEGIAGRDGVAAVPFDELMAARTAETVSCGQACRQWPDHLNEDDRWYPQGLAGSDESHWAGAPEAEVVVSAWYQRTSPENHAAVDSALKFVSTDDWRYRNVPLRMPVQKDGAWTTEKLRSHNGGAAWAGPYLYATSGTTLYRFDVRDILRDDSGVFLLPDRVYRGVTKEPYGKATLSSISTDWTEGPALVSAEYDADPVTTDVVRWPLSADGELVVEDGAVDSAYNIRVDKDSRIRKVQGVESHEGLYYFSRSAGALERARVGTQDDRAATTWGRTGDDTDIPEDLYAVPGQNMYGQTEERTDRYLFWRPMSELLP